MRKRLSILRTHGLQGQRNVPTSPPGPNHLNSPTDGSTPPTMSLPPELLHLILTPLTLPVYPSAFVIAGLLPDAAFRLTEVLSRHDALAPLRCAILVCKLWYQVGAPLLYSTIFLTSATQARLLKRSLGNNHLLGPMVQRLFVLQKTASTASPAPRLRGIRLSLKPDLQGIFLSILRSCPLLNSLTFTLYGREPLLTLWDQGFLRKSSVGSRIKSLSVSLDGGAMNLREQSLRTLLPDHAFPALEVLQLHDAYLDSRLPSLPSLHTLLISLSTVSKSLQGLTISSAELPSLKTVRLDRIKGSIIFGDNAMEGLETVWAGGKEGFLTFQAGVRQGKATNLKHVILSLHDVPDSELSTLHLPPCMESLALDFHFASTEGFRARALEVFNDSAHLWSKNCRRFRKLMVEYSHSDQSTADFELLAEKTRTTCGLRGISFVFKHLMDEDHLTRGRYYMEEWPIGLFNEMEKIRLE